jgi:hypothetical protein
MATEAQISANRRNAQKSIGPRTAEGKAKSAQNAVKHGLFAQKNVVISENQVEFDHLSEKIMAELAPVGVMETILAERIVSLTWRLKRAERMQNEAIDCKIIQEINSCCRDLSESLISDGPQQRPGKYDDVALGYIATRDFPECRTLERLSMYERRFELSLYKTIKELKKLQQARKAEAAKEEQSQFELGTQNTGDRIQNEFEDYQDELSDFEKMEHALLTGYKRKNEANPSTVRLRSPQAPPRKNQSQFPNLRQNTPAPLNKNNKLCRARAY